MDAAQIDPAINYVIKGKTLKKLLERGIKVNKDHLVTKQDGEKEVISFANEKLVFYVANGAIAAAYVPWRETAVPA